MSLQSGDAAVALPDREAYHFPESTSGKKVDIAFALRFFNIFTTYEVKPMVNIEILTDETDVIMLCKRYWELDSHGAFEVKLRELVPFRRTINYGHLEALVRGKSIARDTRRRCPICGIPQRMGSHSALLPITSQPPCSDSRYLKTMGITRADESARVTSTRKPAFLKKSRFSVSASVLLTSLRHILGVRLHKGFSIHDCAELVPAHTARFINMLHEAGVLKKVFGSEQAELADPTKYFLTDDLEVKEDFAAFISHCTASRSFDFSVLPHLWLDYSAAVCLRVLFHQCVLYCLPMDRGNNELCAVLRMMLANRSIAEVPSMSAQAVQQVAEHFKDDLTTSAYAIALHHSIETQYRLAQQNKFAHQIIASQRPCRLVSLVIGSRNGME